MYQTRDFIEYKFRAHRTGQIFDIYFILNCSSNTYTINFIKAKFSETGFGKYSGEIKLPTSEFYDSIEVFIEIKGYNHLVLIDKFIFEEPQKPRSISFGDYFLLFFLVTAIILIKIERKTHKH